MDAQLHKHVDPPKSLGKRWEKPKTAATKEKLEWELTLVHGPALVCCTAMEQPPKSQSTPQSEMHFQLCTFSPSTGVWHSRLSIHPGPPSSSWNTKASRNQAGAIILSSRTHIKMSRVAAVPMTRALEGTLGFFELHRFILLQSKIFTDLRHCKQRFDLIKPKLS